MPPKRHNVFEPCFLHGSIRRHSQAERHGILVPIIAGSNPAASASGSALASVDKNGPSRRCRCKNLKTLKIKPNDSSSTRSLTRWRLGALAQLVAHMIWDHEAAGSSPACSTTGLTGRIIFHHSLTERRRPMECQNIRVLSPPKNQITLELRAYDQTSPLRLDRILWYTSGFL